MVRKMDSTGRILIPKEIREKLRWATEDRFIIETVNGLIQIKKVEKTPKCAICGENPVFLALNEDGRGVCECCLHKVTDNFQSLTM